MRHLLRACLVGGFLCWASTASADVIAVGDTRIRLAGIEGPRPDLICIRDDDEWECGRSAVDYMREVIGGAG